VNNSEKYATKVRRVKIEVVVGDTGHERRT
jgi:hypothetical protein